MTDLEVTSDTVDWTFGTRTARLGGLDDDPPTLRPTIPELEELDDDDANESLSVVHIRDPRRLVDALDVTWRLDGLADSQGA